jgi:hypothetical protein
MRNNFSLALKIFFSPETFVPFLIGSIFLAVLGNAVYDVLVNWFGATVSALLQIAVGALLIFLGSVWVLARQLSRVRPNVPLLGKRQPKQHRGLILMVSRPEPCRQAIRYHLPRLQQCWLICSTKTLETANALCEEFPYVCKSEPIVINDVYDPLEFRDRVSKIYQEQRLQGWKETDIIADYVGMTSHGSVGMVLACINRNYPLQYTPAQLDKNMNPHESLAPIEIVLN